jgi:integral membrane protein
MLKKYENFKPFTDAEAWGLFRLAAITEAVGWTLLITGIGIVHFMTPGNQLPIQIAGKVHGTLFLLYIVAALVFAPSLGWSKKRTIIAGLASVPPYGSLIFEQWVAHTRRRASSRTHALLTLYAIGTNRIQ